MKNSLIFICGIITNTLIGQVYVPDHFLADSQLDLDYTKVSIPDYLNKKQGDQMDSTVFVSKKGKIQSISSYVWKYDEEKNIISYTHYRLNSAEPFRQQKFYYDENKLIKWEEWNEKKELHYTREYKYKGNHVTEYKSYDGEQKKIKSHFTVQFNNNDQVVEVKNLITYRKMDMWTWTYEYVNDKLRNVWIKDSMEQVVKSYEYSDHSSAHKEQPFCCDTLKEWIDTIQMKNPKQGYSYVVKNKACYFSPEVVLEISNDTVDTIEVKWIKGKTILQEEKRYNSSNELVSHVEYYGEGISEVLLKNSDMGSERMVHRTEILYKNGIISESRVYYKGGVSKSLFYYDGNHKMESMEYFVNNKPRRQILFFYK